MKKCFRRVVSIMLAVCLFCLSACGQGNGPQQGGTDPAQGGESGESGESGEGGQGEQDEQAGQAEQAGQGEQAGQAELSDNGGSAGNGGNGGDESLSPARTASSFSQADPSLMPTNPSFSQGDSSALQSILNLTGSFRPDGEAESDAHEERPWKDHVYKTEKKTVPVYYAVPDVVEETELVFMDGKRGVPYISVEDAAEFIMNCHIVTSDTGYKLTVNQEGPVVTFTRENGYFMMFDFEKDTMEFWDYDGFIVPAYGSTLMDIVATRGKFNSLFQISDNSFIRNGKYVVVNAGSGYGIDFISQDGGFYVPLQTISDFLVSPSVSLSVLYNGENVYAAMTGDPGLLEPILEMYNSTKAGGFDESLAEFTYCELCMVMDYLYGLKEQHDITSFNDLLLETGLILPFLSTDMDEHTRAFEELIRLYLDDGHSTFDYPSCYYTGDVTVPNGKSLNAMIDDVMSFVGVRKKYYPDGVPFYQEVGNTAFITFDQFAVDTTRDFYTDKPDENASDTIGRVLYAFSRIKREDSPVENVVLDLSLNPGGLLPGAAFTIAAFLGDGSHSIHNELSGALVTQNYRVDANLDGVFDEEDSLLDYNLFCLVSPICFSSANLAASVFKNSHKVTILGQTSGGGTCTVLPMSAADGSCFKISSPFQLSYTKNGSFYDIDLGVDPDYFIANKEHFYDREYLNEFVNGIMSGDPEKALQNQKQE